MAALSILERGQKDEIASPPEADRNDGVEKIFQELHNKKKKGALMIVRG